MNAVSPCAFELYGTRYCLGMTPADLKDFEPMIPSQAKDHVRPGQKIGIHMVHSQTNARITLYLTNRNRLPCRVMDAAIYGLHVSFEENPRDFIKIFPAPNASVGLDGTNSLRNATNLLGTPDVAKKAYMEEVVEERTRTEVVTEVTEEEWDDYIDFIEEEVEYEVPYEDKDFVHHDATALWRTDDCVLLLHHEVKINQIDFYRAGDAPEKLAPKPITGFKRTFLKIRSVCCFTTLLSTLGLVGLIFSDQLPEFLQSLAWIAVLLGWVSALFACPWHLLKTVGKIIGWSFAFGFAAFAILCILTTPIGIAVGGAILLFLQSIVTIPYYIKKLRPQLNK